MTWREKTLVSILLLVARIVAAGIGEFDPALAADLKSLATHISVHADRGGGVMAEAHMTNETAERVYTTIDKSDWGDGPWQDEPDKVQWKDEATGLPCLAKRDERLGHLCGYVGVGPGHAAYEKDYDAVYDLFPSWDHDGYLEVHGGLTYAAHCQHGDEAEAICHVPDPGEPDDVWWLGFDCAHSGDLSPYSLVSDREAGYGPIAGETYRTLDYVRAQCAKLARQLVVVAAGAGS